MDFSESSTLACYNKGCFYVKTIIRTFLPELDNTLKNSFFILKNKKSCKTYSKIVLRYSASKNNFKQYFAQILKSKNQSLYVVVLKKGSLNDLKNIKFKYYKSFYRAWRKYRNFFHKLKRYRKKHKIFKFKEKALLSFKRPEIMTENCNCEAVKEAKTYTSKQIKESVLNFFKSFVVDIEPLSKLYQNDYTKTCVGFATQQALVIAKEILDKLEFFQKKTRISTSLESEQKFREVYFNLVIPSSLSENCGPPLINSFEKIEQRRILLRALSDDKNAIIESKLSFVERCNFLFNILKNKVELLEETNPLVRKVKNSIQLTSISIYQPTKVNFLELFQYDNTPSVDDCNKKLLWFGLNFSTLSRVLQDGLPFSYPSTANSMGCGLYFSDVVSDAIRYCYPNFKPEKETADGVLLLCEVNLGKSKEIDHPKPFLCDTPPNYDSITAIGRYQHYENDVFVDKYGASFCFGDVFLNESILTQFYHNKYVVYHASKTKIRYLVRVSFQKNNR